MAGLHESGWIAKIKKIVIAHLHGIIELEAGSIVYFSEIVNGDNVIPKKIKLLFGRVIVEMYFPT